MDVLLLFLGLGTLVIGGELLVRGAIGFSKTMKISPLVIGMTIVAFGTSAPELIVSLTSALHGNPGIAVGNVVGSNIANIALVLGVTVLIFPIIAERQSKVVDLPMMIFVTFLLFFYMQDGMIELYEGISMVVIIVIFTYMLIRNARKKKEEINEDSGPTPPFWMSAFRLSAGLAGLYFGADWFVDGAVGIANYFLGDNPEKDTIIGVTIVAFGTSAPELVTSTVAAYRKQTDISLGNLIGSNIFNILVVLGITSIAKPIPVTPETMGFDMYWVIGVALLLVVILAFGSKIGRGKGVILVLTYIAYISITLLKALGYF